MAKQTVNLGASPTGVGGDTPRSANTKINDNFTELYNKLYAGLVVFSGNIDTFSSLPIGKVYVTSDTAGTKPVAYGILETTFPGGGSQVYTQDLWEVSGVAGVTNSRFTRDGYNGSWGPWRKVYHSGNIVGAVAQSSGLPTGAIVETGTNANGTYTKFADGTLICQGPIADFAVGAGAVATVSPAATFPIPFASVNYFIDAKGGVSASNDVYGFMGPNSKSTTSATMVYRNGATAQSVVGTRYLAIGRWF